MTGPKSERLDPIAVSLAGAHLIEASAGTGKTHAITDLFVRLLVERRLEPRDILVVTYTIAATAELRGRVRERVRQALAAFGDPDVATGDLFLDALVAARCTAGETEADRRHLSHALRSFDEAAVFTIHGFCLRVLQDCAFESKAAFETDFLPDPRPLLHEIACDFWTRSTVDAPAAFVEYLRGAGYGPERFAALALEVTQDPRMRLSPTPESIGEVDLAAAETTWRAAAERAAVSWNEHRAAVVELLCKSPALSRSKYRVTTIEGKWLPFLDDRFARPRPGFSAQSWFARLTPTGLADGTKKRETPPTHEFFDACGELLAADSAYAAALERQARLLELELCVFARAELPRRKKALAVRSYDDLLHDLRDAVDGDAGDALVARVRQRYAAALIDEFQDTDKAQYELFKRLFGGDRDSNSDTGDPQTSWFLIGDPKQAIYAFRGADVFAYVDAKRDTVAGADGDPRVLTLDVNWRSDPSLLRGLNAVFGAAHAPFLIDTIDYLPAIAQPTATDRLVGGGAALRFLWTPGPGGKRNIWSKEDSRAMAGEAVARDIARLLNSGATIDGVPVRPGDIAVLCRTNQMAKEVQPYLRRAGVPSVLQGDSTVFNEVEAAELEAVLNAVAEPGSAGAVKAALVTTIFGLDVFAVAALEVDEQQWDSWVGRFWRWHRLWEERGFIQAFRSLLEEADVSRRLLRLVDGERRLTNVLHLGELLQHAASERRLGPVALAQWLARTRANPLAVGNLGENAAQLRLESDADAVRLVTIHKSKGLQYPIVYCAELWNGMGMRRQEGGGVRFHDPDDGVLTLDLDAAKDSDSVRAATWEAAAENLRLAYVALTRARHQCTVIWGQLSGIDSSGLGYLLHQPATDPGNVFAAAAYDWAQSVEKRIRELSDDAMAADLDALVTRGGGDVELIDMQEAAASGASRFDPARSQSQSLSNELQLRCRQLARAVPDGRTVSSFSALTAGAYGGGGGTGEHGAPVPAEAAEGLDYDRRPGGPGFSDASELESGPPDAAAVAGDDDLPLADFPAGADTGLMIHELLEHLDFTAATPELLATAAAEGLARRGMAADLAPSLAAALDELLAAPLPHGASLGDVPRDRRLDELEFLYPTGRGDGLLSVAGLAAVYTDSSAEARSPDLAAYGERLARLAFAPNTGYLKGYIDLVFCHDDRWYVVDYKSNHLGRRAVDYGPERLDRVMAEHHYILQSHLYALAVHRYLCLRLPGYSYEQHFGGIYYLFIRGIGPERPGCGIFSDRPTATLIETLAAGLGVVGQGSRV